MKLSDILDALGSSELHTLSCVENGEVTPENYARVVTVINRGLVKLATRFALKKAYLKLQTQVGVTTYVLVSENAVSSGNPTAYIMDTLNNPFNTEGLLEVLSIKDTDDCPIALDGSEGLLRTAVNKLCFKEMLESAEYTVMYSELPKRITGVDDTTNPNSVEVDLPLAYLNALIYFIASSFHSPTLSGLDGTARATLDISYHQKYEVECAMLESKGIDIDEDVPTNLFHQRGFI